MNTRTPDFAIIGHPNEGKSSVLSTLAEDDSVRVSPTPGETVYCQSFPVIIDGKEIIRFIDTPGFQNPRRTLLWMQEYTGREDDLLAEFIRTHKDDPAFQDDCELLKPVINGAGIIFVVDGSRPVRRMDRAEMEILRLTGAARMAIINSKEAETEYIADWHAEFRKSFNAIRIFNCFSATYTQRIELLESLKSMDQQLEPILKKVVTAFTSDWQRRNERTAEIITALLHKTLTYKKSGAIRSNGSGHIEERLQQSYTAYLAEQERNAHKKIRDLYKHNIFNISLPEHSLVAEDLFSEKTWKFLGLTQRQVILAGAMGGAAVGAGLDVAAAGISFGVFSALGSLAGAATTAMKGKDLLGNRRIFGVKASSERLQVGPAKNIQLLYILLDRSFLYYRHVINWSHGRRDNGAQHAPSAEEVHSVQKEGYTSHWTREQHAVCEKYFRAIQKKRGISLDESEEQLHELLVQQLQGISQGE